MQNNLHGGPSVPADIGQINPDHINPQLLKDVSKIIEPVISSTLPAKRSGFPNATYIMFQVCILLLGLSPSKTAHWLETKCKSKNISFQSFKRLRFSNNKNRRFFPDQPALSRYLKRLDSLGNIEEFWNLVLLAHLLYLKNIKLVGTNLKLIADYTEEPCKKNKNDSYCFGKKDGKTNHKTLTFSIISGDLHQVIANYKIKKKQEKIPLFEDTFKILCENGFKIVYTLLDRGFYTKNLLSWLKKQGVTVIMPGRKSAQTTKKITQYLKNKGSRYCKGFLKLKYVKKIGYPKLNFDLLLVAKRKYTLAEIKYDLKTNKSTIKEASKRIFPLIIMFGKNGGITNLHGNESYIRDLYRQRWLIEIAFREMNRLGISNRSQNRNARLGIMGAKSLLYNMWQVQRLLVRKENVLNPVLELDEFLGRSCNPRYPLYICQNRIDCLI